MKAMALTPLCKSDELAPQTVVCKRVPGIGEIAVVRLADNGEIVAFDPRCPHARGPLAAGKIKGNVLVCPWHFFRFDLRTGKVAGGESILRLERYPVTVENGEIFVEAEKRT
jgi:nitrite reductase/ring-hydroxylating ferredoxin subunit